MKHGALILYAGIKKGLSSLKTKLDNLDVSISNKAYLSFHLKIVEVNESRHIATFEVSGSTEKPVFASIMKTAQFTSFTLAALNFRTNSFLVDIFALMPKVWGYPISLIK